MTIRVVLADDQMLLRATFSLLINSAPDLEVVGEAGTGREAIAIAQRERPDVMLMDIRMPDIDGISATAAITADPGLAGVHILILTTFETEDLVLDALRAGASAYLGMGVHPTRLLSAIRSVASGEALLSPVATRTLISKVLSQPATAPRIPAGLHDLTPRETEILTLVGLGLTNGEIADRLVISPQRRRPTSIAQ